MQDTPVPATRMSPGRSYFATSLAVGLFGAATLVFSSSLSAQQTEELVNEIVVTANRIPIPLRQIGTSVSVMNGDEIQAHGNLSLPDILRQMPAISASGNGGQGKSTSVRIRGEETFRTLTILDGIRIQDPSGTQLGTAFEHLLSDDIGRIEVLRGPQGLAYGADAGGVINISTHAVEEGFRASGDAQTGRYGTSRYAVNLSGGTGRVDYFIAATDYATDGFNTRASDTTLADDDGYENTSLHARLGFELNNELRLELVRRDVDGSNEFDGCFSLQRVDDCQDSYDLQASRLALEYTSETVTHSLSYNLTETHRENFALGISGFTAEGELTRWEYVGSASTLPGFDLVFGADREEASNNGVGRNNTGAFVEYLSDFSDAIYFTAGIRHDDNEDFGNNTSYRISGAYLVDLSSGTLKFKAATGTGFRAPSPFEISYNAGPFAFPPASGTILAQEESDGWEAGIEFSSAAMRLEAVYFDQDVENAIFFDLSTFSGYLQDTGSSHSRGVELSAEVMLGESWRALGNYTFNDTERPDGTQRLRRPENLFNAGLMHQSMDDRFRFALFYRAQSNSIDSGNVALEDFSIVDISASYQLSDSWRIYARIENLFDEEYQEVADFNSASSAAYLGINFSLTR